MITYIEKIDRYMKKKQEWLTRISRGELKDEYWTETDSLEFLSCPSFDETEAVHIWAMLIPYAGIGSDNCPFCINYRYDSGKCIECFFLGGGKTWDM